MKIGGDWDKHFPLSHQGDVNLSHLSPSSLLSAQCFFTKKVTDVIKFDATADLIKY